MIQIIWIVLNKKKTLISTNLITQINNNNKKMLKIMNKINYNKPNSLKRLNL